MAVNQRTLAALRRQRAEQERVLSASESRLITAWARAWEELAAEVERLAQEVAAQPTASRTWRALKARDALAIASRQLQELCEAAGVQATGDARRLVQLAADHQRVLVATQMHEAIAVQWVSTHPATIQAIINRTAEQITARHRHLSIAAQESVRRELVRGMAAGINSEDIAHRIIRNTEGAFNGGLTRALVISRTETGDAYTAAATESRRANRDVLQGWQWYCSLTRTSCRSCISHHGEIHPLDDPGPLDHQQGRCVAIPLTRSWEDLGFKGIPEPPGSIKPGDGEKWLRSQPEKVQRDILGTRGLEAYRAGDYPPQAWTTLHKTGGWRDSYRVSPMPKPVGN